MNIFLTIVLYAIGASFATMAIVFMLWASVECAFMILETIGIEYEVRQIIQNKLDKITRKTK